MEATVAIDKQISKYFIQLSPAQKKAVLYMMKALKDDEENAYETEMNKRFEELESGTVKGYTWDEAVAHARKSYRSSKEKE